MVDQPKTTIRRAEISPGLALAAHAACVCHFTDGFCSPANVNDCQCWDKAQAVQQATGLSARGVAWVFQHTTQIEKEVGA